MTKIKIFLLFFLLQLPAMPVFAQDYEFTLNPRRAYDQIIVEIWAKTVNKNAVKTGNASLVIQYNTSFFTPASNQNLTQTDSLTGFDANSTSPVRTITSQYNAMNGYAALASASYSNGYYSLEVTHERLGELGLLPDSTGRGSFIGKLTLSIIGNPSETDLANISWSKNTLPGDVRVFDYNGNDIKSKISFIDPPSDYKIIGITFLSAKDDKSVIDRDGNYNFLTGEYANSGYPIYFERSINPALYTIPSGTAGTVDEDLAYIFEYSLDNGATWLEIGRTVETDKNASTAAKSANHKSGELFESKAATGYIISTMTGAKLDGATFRQPLRVIWAKNTFFTSRSEQAKLKITMLDGDVAMPVTNRLASNIYDINKGRLILGRLFFLQLNGTTQYLKTTSTFSNSTQLTVAAWVNLNAYPNTNDVEPAIIASSGGPGATPVFGSNEGAWMLYLKNGRIPAFRAREILNRGDSNALVNTKRYIGICEAYDRDILTAVSAVEPLSEEHSQNWVHLAATVKDNTISLFVNGELVDQVINDNANDIRMLVTEHPVWIGVNPNGTISADRFLNTGIKGVQVWRTALTQEQIRAYAPGINRPDSITSYDDVKKGLELYYPFEGSLVDMAINPDYQKGRDDAIFYDDAVLPVTPVVHSVYNVVAVQSKTYTDNHDKHNNYEYFLINGNIDKHSVRFASTTMETGNIQSFIIGKYFPSTSSGNLHIQEIEPVEITNILYSKPGNTLLMLDDHAGVAVYRPDKPHVRISSPAKDAGVLNKENDNFVIRWVSYGLGDIAKTASKDIEVEYSLDNGATWHFAKSPAGIEFGGNNAPDAETGQAIWQPYQNNNANANLRTITPYAKKAIMRISGTQANGQTNLYSISDEFNIAPYFGLSLVEGTRLQIAPKEGMNINSNYAYMEAWIKPYRFPTDAEVYLPLIEKTSPGTDGKMHYSLRLHTDGTLSFVLEDKDGNWHTARTGTDHVITRPNSVQNDSTWTHVGILFIKNNKDNISEARFYIDGVVQGAGKTASNFTSSIQLNGLNEYPLYIGYKPANLLESARSFVGEFKEIRFWSGLPNNLSIAGEEPTPLTVFIQSAQSATTDNLQNAYKQNLHSTFSMDGGAFVIDGVSRAVAKSPNNNVLLRNFGTPVKYVPFMPFVKLVEPIFRQSVANTNPDVRVRWVGLNYDGLNFTPGEAKKDPPSLEYSIRGGGGNVIQPYQYVGSLYWSGNKFNSIKMAQGDRYLSKITSNDTYIALSLDASIADPDVNKDANFNDQGPLSPSLTNARFRLTGSYTINNEKKLILSEGPLFTITPTSNFNTRVMLEGYHNGNISGKSVNNLATSYEQGGLRITLFKDNSGEIGSRVGSAESKYGFSDRDPVNMNKGNLRFGNVNFVFTDVTDGYYWLLVEHINHLPVMSRYPVPFQFTGDISSTWDIESGWDFLSWNGVDNNVLPNANTKPWAGNYFTAKGTAVNSPKNDIDRYSTTGLIYNGGASLATNSLAAMVAGDVNQDKMINAADRVIVRQEEGLISPRSDVTGDKYVNAIDRTIVDRNYGKVSSLYDVTMPTGKVDVENIIANTSKTHNDSNDYEKKLINSDLNTQVIEPVEINIVYGKPNNRLLAAFNYDVYAEPKYFDDGYVELSMYIKNNGDAFAPANCTFAVSYNSSVLDFQKLTGQEDVLFNSTFDYSNLDNQMPNNGYLKLQSAPHKQGENYGNIRTIEIDYDAYANIGGINVPDEKTYLGTLRFKVIENQGVIAFDWHESKAVLTTKGYNVTDNGTWHPIAPIVMYSVKITSPNGGEKYSQNKNQNIAWTAIGKAGIWFEFSNNAGTSWVRLNDEAVSANVLNYEWITPNYTSNSCLIRILDAATGIEMDRSDDVFAITAPFGYILEPYAATEPYTGGAKTTIKWQCEAADCVQFEFSDDAGATWTGIQGQHAANLTQTSWTLPKITTRTAMLRMMECGNGVEIARTGIFKILNGSLVFTTPKLKEVLYAGKAYKVKWSTKDVDIFDLDLTLDGGNTWSRVEANTVASDLLISWLVPDIETDQAMFRALYQGDETMEYGRGKLFRIKANGSIDEELPAGYNIENPYPNPAQNSTQVYITVPDYDEVSLSILDMSGRTIKNIYQNMQLGAGVHKLSIDIAGLPSAKYFMYFKSSKLNTLRELTITR